MKPHYDNVRAGEGSEWPDSEDTQLMMCKPQVPGFRAFNGAPVQTELSV